MEERGTDKKNFSEHENRNWGLSFSPVDISLCFGIYVLSAVILIVVNNLLVQLVGPFYFRCSYVDYDNGINAGLVEVVFFTNLISGLIKGKFIFIGVV